nr:hypothetical protein [Tanacetum cinerariifolium]
MAFVSFSNNNTSSTDGAINTTQVINTAHGVSTTSTQVNVAYSTNIDNLSDAIICVFFSSQPNSPKLILENLQQIHPDDMKEIYLRWQMTMLTIRARRECIASRNQDNKNKGSSRRSVLVKTSTSTALVSCDGLDGYDWSDQAEEGPNYALMAFSSSSFDSEIVDNFKKGLGYKNYNAVPPPYIRNFMPPTPDLSFNGLDEFVNEPVVENCKAMSSKEQSKVVRKYDDTPRNKEWVSNDEEEDVPQPKLKRKQIENLVDHKVKVIGCYNGTEFKNKEMNQFCEMKGILRQFSVARTPQQNGVAKRSNKTLIEAARTMLADSKLPTTFLSRSNHLGKFDGKADEGFFVRYSLNSKAFRVFNSRTQIVEENLHIRFSESTSNVVGSGTDWLFDIDALSRIMNYEPITADLPFSQAPKSSHNDGSKPASDDGKKVDEDPRNESEYNDQEKEDNVNSTNNVNTDGNVNTVSSNINVVGTNKVNVVGGKLSIELPFDPKMPALEDDSIFDFSSDDEDDGAVADMNNLDTTIQVSPILTTRIHKDHPLDQVIEDLQSATQTRKMSKNLEKHGFEEPKKVIHALKYPSWIEAMNKKDERGIMIRNKARLVAQGYTQEERIDYDEVFTPVARNEAIRLYLAYASFKDFVVYQMDIKSVFLYEKIEEEVHVCQPSGFEDPDFLDRVYEVEKALYKGAILLVQVYVDDTIFGSTKKELCITFERLTHEKFQMSSMRELTFFLRLQVKLKKDGIFICQDKYVAEILKKFRFTKVKSASTSMETQKPLLKDEDDEEVDVHMYRSMISSLMYLTSSRPDNMFALCACARYQVNPKVSHLHAVKRIF